MPLTLVVEEGITSITGDTDTLMMVTGGTEHPLCPLRGGEWQLMVITAPSAGLLVLSRRSHHHCCTVTARDGMTLYRGNNHRKHGGMNASNI